MVSYNVCRDGAEDGHKQKALQKRTFWVTESSKSSDQTVCKSHPEANARGVRLGAFTVGCLRSRAGSIECRSNNGMHPSVEPLSVIR